MDVFGALHVACNNAGVSGGGLSWEIDLETWRWILDVDLWGVIHGVRTFTPLIIASGGGHIVNTASMAGLTSNAGMTPYNVAKHGVVTLSETMYVELQMTHPEVGVSVLCPGWVRTRINESRTQPSRSDGRPGSRSELDPGTLAIKEMVEQLDRRGAPAGPCGVAGGRGDPGEPVLRADPPRVAGHGARPGRPDALRGEPLGEAARELTGPDRRSVRSSATATRLRA